MTLTEFKARFIKDQQHIKRMKLWQAGHTDAEIAACCNVHRRSIQSWRTAYNLPRNIINTGKGYKAEISRGYRFKSKFG